jgi:hypothetical protein
MTLCVCGNVIGPDRGYRMTCSPCQCKKPGEGRSTILRESFLDDISPQQYAQRKRLGLPIVAEIEKSHIREVFR